MKNWYCFIFGHRYVLSKKVTDHVNEYRCKRCCAELTVDANGKLVPMTEKNRLANEHLHLVYNRKIEQLSEEPA